MELSEYNDMTAVKEDIDHYLTQQSSEFVKQILQDYEDEVDEERRRDDAGAGEEEEGDGYQEQDGEQEESFYDQLAEVEEQALQEDEYYPEEYVDNEVPPTYEDYNEYNEYPEEFYDEEVGDIEGQDGPLVEEEEEETPPPVENHRKDDRRRYTPTILSEEEEYLSQYEDDEDIGGYLEKGKQLPEEVLIEEFRDRINHGKKNIQPAIQHTEVHAFNSKKIAFHHRGSLLVEDLDML